MTTDTYLKVADRIVGQMDKDGKAFVTKTRMEITTLLRDISGQPRSKIGASVGDAIEAALDHRGFRAFPHLNEVDTSGSTRIIRRGTYAEQLLNAWLHPGTMTDDDLAQAISKVKQHDKDVKQQRGGQA
jgi:hypothetical protein